jgi:Protein of unknown function (DUF3891)
MILQRTPDGIVAIRQEDHAAMAAFFLEHWSDHNFAHDPEREKIILATREHDNGWHEFDAKPRLDEATGLPADFRSMTAEETVTIWQRGTAKYLESDPFVALLITHHGYSLHEQEHKRNPAWKQFFTEFAQLRAEIRNRLGLTQPDVERAYSYLRMMDWFSLAYCMNYELGREKPEQYAGYNFRRTGAEFLFRPYPFDARGLHYKLPTYPMRPEGYASQQELAAAFKTPVIHEVTLTPLGRTR